MGSVTGWPCTPKWAVASLETLSIMESFLGIASAPLGFGRLAMHNSSPGSLCHATQASAWGNLSRVPCLTGLVCVCGLARPGCLLGFVRWSVQVVHSVQATLLRAGCIYEGLPSGGPHKPQSFSALLHLASLDRHVLGTWSGTLRTRLGKSCGECNRVALHA